MSSHLFSQLGPLLTAVLLQPHDALLHAARQQRTILGKDALRDDAPLLPGPRALHLAEHPLVGPNLRRLVEVDAVIQAHQHAHLRPALPLLQVRAHTLKLHGPPHGLRLLLGERLPRGLAVLRLAEHVAGREREAPQAVDSRDGADEVAVRHVRKRIQMRLVPALIGDAPLGAHPRPASTVLRRRGRVGPPMRLDPAALKGRAAPMAKLQIRVVVGGGRGEVTLGPPGGVADHLLLLAGLIAVRAGEADGGGEDAPAPLAGLNGARGKGAAVADALDVEEDGDAG